MRDRPSSHQKAQAIVGWISLIAWGALIITALFLLLTSGCAPIHPGTPQAAMRKHYPDWSMTAEDEQRYNEFIRSIPPATRVKPGPPPCIDQFTGRLTICDTVFWSESQQVWIVQKKTK